MNFKIAILFILLTFSCLLGQSTPTVVVLPLESSSVYKNSEVETFLATITEGMKKCSNLTFVTRTHLDKVLKQQALSLHGEFDQTTGVAIGKLLGAHYIVVGSINEELGKQKIVTLRLISIETGEVFSPVSKSSRKILRALTKAAKILGKESNNLL